MSDSLPPITDETLAAIEARLDAATPGPWHKDDGEFGCVTIGDYGWTTPPGVNAPEYDVDSPQGHADAELIAHAPTDLRRLLDEVQRLRAEASGYRSAICFETTCTNCAGMVDRMAGAEADLERSRSECAALTAKAEAAAAVGERVEGALAHIRECLHIGLQDAKLYDEAGTKRIDEWADFIDKQIRAALGGSGMPHTPAQEAREYRCPNCDRWAEWTDGIEESDDEGPDEFWCQTCGDETPLADMDSRPQEARGDAGTSDTGSGRGTGVREPHARPQGGSDA